MSALRFFELPEVVVPVPVAFVEPFACESLVPLLPLAPLPPVACVLLVFPSSATAPLRAAEPVDLVVSAAHPLRHNGQNLLIQKIPTEMQSARKR